MAHDRLIPTRRWAAWVLLTAAFATYLASLFFEWRTVTQIIMGAAWLLLATGLVVRAARGRHASRRPHDRSIPSDPLQDIIGGRKPSGYVHDADTGSHVGAAPPPDPLHLPERPE